MEWKEGMVFWPWGSVTSETRLLLKSRNILFVHSFFINRRIILTSCTAYGDIADVLCGEYQKDLWIKIDAKGGRNFPRFQSKMPFGMTVYILLWYPAHQSSYRSARAIKTRRRVDITTQNLQNQTYRISSNRSNLYQGQNWFDMDWNIWFVILCRFLDIHSFRLNALMCARYFNVVVVQ